MSRDFRSFSPGRAPRSAQQLRADWVAAIMLAGSLAGTAHRQDGAERDPAFGQNLTRLTLTVRDLAPENFPVQASSARSMAAAFLKLAKEFPHPAWSPAARTACAGFLLAGASCLDGLLTDLRTEEARGTSRMLGEKDED